MNFTVWSITDLTFTFHNREAREKGSKQWVASQCCQLWLFYGKLKFFGPFLTMQNSGIELVILIATCLKKTGHQTTVCQKCMVRLAKDYYILRSSPPVAKYDEIKIWSILNIPFVKDILLSKMGSQFRYIWEGQYKNHTLRTSYAETQSHGNRAHHSQISRKMRDGLSIAWWEKRIKA